MRLLLIIICIIFVLYSCTNAGTKSQKDNIHTANDTNNMLYEGIPPGDERRQAIAKNNLKSENYAHEKMGELKKEIDLLDDRIRLGVENDIDKLNLLKVKYNMIESMVHDTTVTHMDLTKDINYCQRNWTSGIPADLKKCQDKWEYNSIKLFWDYVDAQAYLDKGSITQEEFKTIEKRILDKDNATIAEIDKIMYLQEIPKN